MEAAEIKILYQNHVVIPATKWKKFEAWVNNPAKYIPALKKLSKSRPAWQD